jgi:hypothetical protein
MVALIACPEALWILDEATAITKRTENWISFILALRAFNIINTLQLQTLTGTPSDLFSESANYLLANDVTEAAFLTSYGPMLNCSKLVNISSGLISSIRQVAIRNLKLTI